MPSTAASPEPSTLEGESHGRYQLILLGDLTTNGFYGDLRFLLHVKTDALLVSFFERTGFALRRLIGALPALQQNLFPRFTTLIDLVAKVGETEGTPILRFFLLSVHQVAQFIVYADENRRYGRGGEPYPSAQTTCVVGPCAGGFAAAAICSSQTLTELIPAAVESVLAAFRTAHLAYMVGQDLSSPQDSSLNKAWSAVVSPKSKANISEILQGYQNKKIHISATMPNNRLTLTGPPHILDDFLQQHQSCLKYRYLDIFSPFHAAHLFDASVPEKIVGHISNELVADRIPDVGLLSGSTGKVANAPNFRALLQATITDVLREPVQWDSILSAVQEFWTDHSMDQCTVIPFSSNSASMVCEQISKAGPIQVSVEDVAGDIRRSLRAADTSNIPTGRFVDSKIAIIGFSGRFPSADSNEAFWDLLRAGRDVHRDIPSDRFDWKAHYDMTGKTKNTSRIRYGCFIDDPGNFDARFFNMSPREAENTDPAQRLAITTTYEAMEMAGMVRNRTPSTQQDRIGVFFGTTSDADTKKIGARSIAAKTWTPISSLEEIELLFPVESGGTNVLTNPDNFAGLDRGHFLSTTGNCNAFDDGANGYCRADAVGSVILKRLEDAEADNDPIFGVIVGSTTNHCGQTDSITRPHEGDQCSVFKRIMRYTNYDPLDVGYIEMHGTGTQAGDATEMRSVLSVFASNHRRSQAPARPLYLGSAKANIGHAESASGVSSLIKVLMMMKHNEIPPHCGIKSRINHSYPLDLVERGVNIASQPTPWRREDTSAGKRACFLNNFSAAGGNTAVLLEDAPTERRNYGNQASADPRPVHLVSCTGRSAKSLLDNARALVSWLQNNPITSLDLPAVSYTTTARRMHHNYRTIVSGSSLEAILAALNSKITQLESVSPKQVPQPANTPKIVFTFTGQGGIYASMGKVLFDCNSKFRESITRFDHLAQVHGFPSFVGLIDGSHTADAQEASPATQQLAMACLQMALTELLGTWGVKPSAVIGHSLGEYAGLHAAGVLSAPDVIYLVGTRATLLEKHCRQGTHAMLAVKAPMDIVNGLLSHSGCGYLERRAKAMNIDTRRLDVPYAFHSAQVDPILDEFLRLSSQAVVYNPPNVPVLSPLMARTVSPGDKGQLDGKYLTRACRNPVVFFAAVEAAMRAGVVDRKTIWLEVGPNPVCGNMIKGTLGSDTATLSTLRRSPDGFSPLAAMLESLYLSGSEIDWNEYHREYTNSQRVVDLPRYAWDLKRYWIDYRNNFCLSKGENPDNAIPSNSTSLKQVQQYKFISPAVQRVIEEKHGTEESKVVIESDVFDRRLLPVLQGHLVNGAALCPSSLYADIALTIAHYMVGEAGHAAEPIGFDVSSMRVEAPLIALPNEKTHVFRISAQADWRLNQINMTLGSVNETGRITRLHATCVVLVTSNQTWLDDWKRLGYLVQSRVDSLSKGVVEGNCHHIKRGMAYKLFGALVDYGKEYQGMKDVIMDSDQLEAVSTVEFQVGSDGFYLNPRWIDSLGHIAGFIMNANDKLSSKSTVFVNHGWDHMRISDSLEPGKTYRAYNRMHLIEKTLYTGDTYIFDGVQLIAVFEGVTFQGVPRQSLDHLLPNRAAANAPILKINPQATNVSAKVGPPASGTLESHMDDLDANENSKAEREETPNGDYTTSAPSTKIMDRILAIIGEEVGISPSDLTTETEFSEIGIDSLLSLTMTSRIQEELELELASSVFVDNPTIGALQSLVLGEASNRPDANPSAQPQRDDALIEVDSSSSEGSGSDLDSMTDSASSPTPPLSSSATTPGVPTKWSTALESYSAAGSYSSHQTDILPPHATSILLSSPVSLANAKQLLFLFPDGSGSAASYATLASCIGNDVAVYGLNCPWRKDAEDMTRLDVDMDLLASKFLAETQRIICKRIILIDSPNPIGLQNPPQRLYDFFDSIGIFGSSPGKMPAWLRKHFSAFIRVLDEYKPRPLAHAPSTLIIYARDGVCKDLDGPKIEIRPEDPREMRWLLNNRTDFSGDGWATLLGRENLHIEIVDDVNHFSMMDPGSKSVEIGQITARFLGNAIAS
ncbi:hypothetical protein J7T55_004717 [Diaporthe amygdali]|uniref:uncharacterized protein n=1 Tax=Phomopsis amygdali TaxID=1214568 RepID=UPI0022FE9941|nr:uncharacterized protein J7T55_004717 [Diaporthe amygdali]KAJ0114474.1 hypothetical protein J7T55_004717 [Diaporthe amygdali]